VHAAAGVLLLVDGKLVAARAARDLSADDGVQPHVHGRALLLRHLPGLGVRGGGVRAGDGVRAGARCARPDRARTCCATRRVGVRLKYRVLTFFLGWSYSFLRAACWDSQLVPTKERLWNAV